jgi:hypothetical protein
VFRWKGSWRVIAEDLNMNRERARDCKGRFGNEKNFCKMVPWILTHDHIRRLHVIRSLMQCGDV